MLSNLENPSDMDRTGQMLALCQTVSTKPTIISMVKQGQLERSVRSSVNYTSIGV